MNQIRFERLTSNAKTPIKATTGSAGFDLFAAYSVDVPSYGSALILTDISIKMPKGVYARIAPRSGLALMYGITVGAGVIDPDYRGSIGVILFNHGDKDLKINQGDRCAQLIFEKFLDDAELVEDKGLDETVRGVDGFGSTGITDHSIQSEPLNLIIDKNAVCDCLSKV